MGHSNAQGRLLARSLKAYPPGDDWDRELQRLTVCECQRPGSAVAGSVLNAVVKRGRRSGIRGVSKGQFAVETSGGGSEPPSGCPTGLPLQIFRCCVKPCEIPTTTFGQ